MQSSVLLLSLHHLQGTEATQRSLAIVGELSHFASLNHPFSWARGYLSTSASIGLKHSETCRTVHAQAFLGRCKKRAAAGHQSSMHQCDFLTLHSSKTAGAGIRNTVATHVYKHCSYCKDSLQEAVQCIAQPNTTLLDCILYHNTFLIVAFHQALQNTAYLGTCI